IYFMVLVLCFLVQIQAIAVQPPFFFINVIGNIGIGAYLFFANKPRVDYYVPIHLFLWIFLFSAGYELLFYIAGLLFVAASVYYLAKSTIRKSVRICGYAALTCCVIGAVAFHS